MGLSSITVKWEPVPQGSRNGLLMGYQVRYRKSFSNGSDGGIKTIFWRQPANEITLFHLDKASLYSIEVAGRTSAGIGVYSEPVTAKTGTCKLKST